MLKRIAVPSPSCSKEGWLGTRLEEKVMEPTTISNQFLVKAQELSSRYGTGDVINDLTVIGAILAAIALLLATLSLLRRRAKGDVSVGNLARRVEKLEGTVQDLKVEVGRLSEVTRGDINFLRHEVHALRGEEGSAPPAPRESDTPRAKKAEAEESEKKEEPENLSVRLRSSRRGILEKIRNVFASKPELDEGMIEELEVLLVASDLGVKTVRSLLEEIKAEVGKGHEVSQSALTELLKDKIEAILQRNAPADPSITPMAKADGPLVVMVVGVNGAGKTTTVAKLANAWNEKGAKVMMAAADTFRAAAYEQLRHWGETVGVPVIGGAPNARPTSVVFDAMIEAKKQNVDVLIVDTAGRLHTKSNLMQELTGIRNIISRHQPSAPHETLLVVDGTTGQNAIMQAREFHGAVPLTGLVVTKLDGTSKGGVLVAIKDELDIPIRYIGVGESWADLRAFHPREFAEALFESADGEEGARVEEGAHAQERKRKKRWGEAEVPV